MSGEPVSRLWACVFASSPFALLWALKAGRARRWAAMSALLLAPYAAGSLVYRAAAALAGEWFVMAASAATVVAVNLLPALYVAVITRLMHGWATEYNVREFGHPTRGEWRAAGGRASP